MNKSENQDSAMVITFSRAWRVTLIFLPIVCLMSCRPPLTMVQVKKEVTGELAKQKGTFAVAFTNLSTGEKLLINEKEFFHAASTMKTPVLIEVFKQVANGKLSLSDSVIIKDEFKSIVDGSSYRLTPEGDSDQDLYRWIGRKRTIADLAFRMITISSNLATNILIELVGAKSVTRTMRGLGASRIEVLRGVEDPVAYSRGMNNKTTALDLMIIFKAMAKGTTVNQKASEQMIDILMHQTFNDIIPASLPQEVKVAHKTGSFTGVQHDSGIVFLPDGRKYVLVILSKDLTDDKAAVKMLAKVSELIYRQVASKR